VQNEEILDSWKEIANYLERNTRTCIRWEKTLRLPVHRINSKSHRSKVFSYKTEIDEWLKEKSNHKEIKKKFYLENKWMSFGLASGLVLLLTIFSFTFFTHKTSSSSFSENPSIAVLPFEIINSSGADEYLSEGITDGIISNLTGIKDFNVLPLPSVYKQNKSIRNAKKIGTELGVDYILAGNLENSSDKVKLAVQFFRTKDGKKVWNKEFDKTLKDILFIQDSICSNILKVLNVNNDQKLPPKFNKDTTQNFIAFDNYLKGNYILNRLNEENNDPWELYHQGKHYEGKCTRESNELAISFFNQALEIDPNFVLPYFGLARCYANYVNFNWDFDIKWLNKAEDLVKVAQKIEPDLSEYYCFLIEIYLIKEMGFNENTINLAFKLAEEGIKKYSYHSQLNSIVGYCYYLRFGAEGEKADFDKALEYKEKSFGQNPYSISNIVYTELLMLNKEFNRAIEVCAIIKKHCQSLLVDFLQGEIYYYFGDLDKSKTIFQEFKFPLEFRINSLFYLAMIAAQKGEIEEAQRIIQEIENKSPEYYEYYLNLASIYMGIGKKETGYKYLKSFFTKPSIKKMKYVCFKYIDMDNNFNSYKKEKKFKEIINE